MIGEPWDRKPSTSSGRSRPTPSRRSRAGRTLAASSSSSCRVKPRNAPGREQGPESGWSPQASSQQSGYPGADRSGRLCGQCAAPAAPALAARPQHPEALTTLILTLAEASAGGMCLQPRVGGHDGLGDRVPPERQLHPLPALRRRGRPPSPWPRPRSATSGMDRRRTPVDTGRWPGCWANRVPGCNRSGRNSKRLDATTLPLELVSVMQTKSRKQVGIFPRRLREPADPLGAAAGKVNRRPGKGQRHRVVRPLHVELEG